MRKRKISIAILTIDHPLPEALLRPERSNSKRGTRIAKTGVDVEIASDRKTNANASDIITALSTERIRRQEIEEMHRLTEYLLHRNDDRRERMKRVTITIAVANRICSNSIPSSCNKHCYSNNWRRAAALFRVLVPACMELPQQEREANTKPSCSML